MKNILDEVHANVVQEELLKARNKSSEAAQMRAQQSVVEVRAVLYLHAHTPHNVFVLRL